AGLADAADRLAARTLAEDPAYAALLGHDELRDRIHGNLRQALAGMTALARGLPVELSDAATTGALRAEQGLPLASLLASYRRGGRLLWQTLTTAVAAHDPAALPRLLPGAALLWDVLEQMQDAVTEAYRRIETARCARDQERRHALLDALLDGTGPAPGPASEAAARLGLPERGRFAVVALAAEGDRGRAVVPADPAGPQVLWRMRAGGDTGVVQLGTHPLAAVRDLLAPLGARAGVSPVVTTPAELAHAHWLAGLALRTATAGPADPGPVLLDDHLPAALVAAQPELAGRLARVVLGPVLALPPEEARVLLTTLEAWLAAGGRTSTAADRLFCHRNTVSNRLRRLESLTARSLSTPSHVVELALARAAVGVWGV
ncbi:helix-turn-helix domain-containing protein, partial [Streptomyces sp. NPDC089919]|uniref:PucR family transcriptional regulator n=1 Tax=Streptomyces sp. NPDC089919 TaxID=3155188 RepID=UPI003433D746